MINIDRQKKKRRRRKFLSILCQSSFIFLSVYRRKNNGRMQIDFFELTLYYFTELLINYDVNKNFYLSQTYLYCAYLNTNVSTQPRKILPFISLLSRFFFSKRYEYTHSIWILSPVKRERTHSKQKEKNKKSSIFTLFSLTRKEKTK